MIHADTNRLLDLCSECLAVAGWENGQDGHIRARCTECCETGEWEKDYVSAMISFNLMQREKSKPKVFSYVDSKGTKTFCLIYLRGKQK
jgi:hypothetical protein